MLGWSDGSSKASAGAFGWCLVSRGSSITDLTLEGVGGGWAPEMDSCGAEVLGALAISEALRLRAGNHDPPAGWQECPTDIWTACYSRLLRQIRAPPTTRWAQNDESHILEYLYDMDWNQ